MIETKHLEEFLREHNLAVILSTPIGREYKREIIKRLRAYDRICRDLEQLIATLSNVVDAG